MVYHSEQEGETEDDDKEEYSECDAQECSYDLYEPMNNSEEYRDPSITTIKRK